MPTDHDLVVYFDDETLQITSDDDGIQIIINTVNMPAGVAAGDGILVSQGGGTYTVAIDPDMVVTTPSGGGGDGFVPYFNGSGTVLGNSSIQYNDATGNITIGGGVTINPAALSTTPGVVVTQTSPTSGTAAGPLNFNSITVNDQYGLTTPAVDSFGLSTAHSSGLTITVTEGGSNITGYPTGLYVRLNHTIGDSDIVHGDHIGAVFIATSDKDANGHGIYASNHVVWLRSGADHPYAVGAEYELAAYTGATVTNKVGIRLHSYGDVQGSTLDSALTVVSSGVPWKNFVNFSEIFNAQSIDSAGSMFKATQAFTIANIFDLANVTVTGSILSFPTVTLTAAGVLTLNGTGAALPAPVANTVLHVGRTGSTEVLIDSFGTGADSSVVSRSSRGTAAAPSASQANDLLGAHAFAGYGTSAYSASSRSAIFGYAAENWTNSAQGSYIDILTTPTGSTTKAISARFTAAGGIVIGGVGAAAAGSITGTGSAVFNGLLASGGATVGNGELRLGGNTSGVLIQTVQSAAGTPTVTWGTSTGTPAVTATTPLTITAATGNIVMNGLTALATGDLLSASATDTFSRISAVAVGAVLSSGGAGTLSAWDTTPYISGSVAIGANTAVNSGVLLQLNANTAALPAGTFSGTVLQIGGADASPARVYMDAFTSTATQSATFSFRKSRGTAASRSAIQSGDALGAFFWDGFDGTGYNASDAPAIIGVATENFTTTAHGTRFDFRPVPNTTLLSVLAMTIHNSGGVTLGVAPTGGDKGIGTLNATGVYDDNTLLTCYPFDQALDGTIDVKKWDDLVPNRRRFKRVKRGRGRHAEWIDAPISDEKRHHDPLRKFMARIGTEHDPMRLESYIAHWKEKRHLTSLPNETKFDPEQNLPVGAWTQRLIETVELQALHDSQLLDELIALRARVETLEVSAAAHD